MDLNFTPAEEAFRAEARAWLEANVPVGLPSGDTAEGFALHVEWERNCSTPAGLWCLGPRNTAAAVHRCGNGSSLKRSTTELVVRSA